MRATDQYVRLSVTNSESRLEDHVHDRARPVSSRIDRHRSIVDFVRQLPRRMTGVL